MSLKRIYTFEEQEGFGVNRVTPAEAAPEDRHLAPIGLTNWQLAILYIIRLEGTATTSDIGFALVMDRPTVAKSLKPLQARRAVREDTSARSRKGAVALTEEGSSLLFQGLVLWRNAHPQPRQQGETDQGATARTADALIGTDKKFA